MTNLKTGKRPAQPARPHLKLAALRTGAAPTPPAVVDYYSRISSIGMLGNDEYGDCVFAGLGHIVEQDTQYAAGTEDVVTTAEALAAYSAVTGFDPDDPDTDQGTYTQDAYTWWRKNSFAGQEPIAAFASVSLTDWTEIENAIDQFGQVGIGFNFPASAMDQFNAGQPWTVVKGSPLEGGHYVVAVGYDVTYIYVLTWGKVQKMDRKFWAKYVDEAWVSVTKTTITGKGANAYGGLVDLAAFGAAFAALTGEPNPFPDVDPTPTPDPGPADGPTGAVVAQAIRSVLSGFDL